MKKQSATKRETTTEAEDIDYAYPKNYEDNFGEEFKAKDLAVTRFFYYNLINAITIGFVIISQILNCILNHGQHLASTLTSLIKILNNIFIILSCYKYSDSGLAF